MVLLDVALTVDVEVFEKWLHLFEVGVVQHDGLDGGQELFKVNILLLFLVNYLDQTVENFLRVVDTEHLRQFDQVVALDAAVAERLVVGRRVGGVVLLDHRIGLEYVVREALSIVLVERDETVGLQDV